MIFDWIVSAVPWWVWTIIAGIVLAATVQFWGPIWLAMPRWMKSLILAVGAFATFGYISRRSGINAERNRQKDREAHAVQNRANINRQVDAMSTSDVDRELARRGDFRKDD